METDLVLPKWKIPPNERSTMSDQAYLDWLSEERERLIKTGELERLRTDPARCPVNVRFRLTTESSKKLGDRAKKTENRGTGLTSNH